MYYLRIRLLIFYSAVSPSPLVSKYPFSSPKQSPFLHSTDRIVAPSMLNSSPTLSTDISIGSKYSKDSDKNLKLLMK